MKRTFLVSLLLIAFAALAFPQVTGVAQRIVLQPAISATGDISGNNMNFSIKDVKEVTCVLKVTSADRTTGNETYDIYVTSGIRLADGTVAKWDVAHFSQIAATGAKTYVAAVKGYGVPYPYTVTTAGPGVAAVVTGTMKTDTAGADQGTGTLTAGMVRHGVLGEFLSYELVTAGTTPILGFSLTAVAK
jgi:hypothetical protein